MHTTCLVLHYHFDKRISGEIRPLALCTRSKGISSEFLSMTVDACLLDSFL